MLNRLTDYYRTHQRSIKKQLRTSCTRPIKDKIYSYQLYFIRELSEFKTTFFQAKNLRFLGIFVILFWLYRDFAFAVGTAGADSGTTKTSEAMNATVDVLNGVIFIVALIAQPIVMFIGWLLSPDWTFGEIIGLRPVIHQVWILVSNVVYFIFAIMLVVIALANIFGEHGGKTFALKAALPKLIMGVIMVPFTWFIVSATLSVTNVLTASVLSFSYDSIVKFQGDTNANQTSFVDKKVIPSEIYVDLTEDDKGDKKKINCDNKADESKCLSLKDVLGNSNGAYNLLTYYAYEIFKIDQLKTLGKDQTGKSINKVGDIFKKLTFGIIFALIFAILIIAIAFALITRMTMLWLYAMFSPVFALSFFLGGGGGKGLEKLNKKMNIKAFVSLAMVPVYVSAALSFGLILLSFAMNADFKQSEYVTISNSGAVDSNGEQTFAFGKGVNKVKLVIKGKYTEGSAGVAGNTFKAGQGIISNVIISFLALIILWMAVMAALGASEITEKAVKPIADFGDAMGKLMVEAPKYIPLKIPGGGKSISLAGIGAMGQSISSSISSAATKSGMEMGQRFGDKVAGSAGYTTNNAVSKIRMLGTDAGKDTGSPEGKAKYIMRHMDESGLNGAGWANDSDSRGEFANNLKKIGIDEAIIKDIRSASKQELFAKALKDLDTKLGGRLFKEGSNQSENDILNYLNNAGGKSNKSEGEAKITNLNLYPTTIEKSKDNKLTFKVSQQDDKGATRLSEPVTVKIENLNKASLEKAIGEKGFDPNGDPGKNLIKKVIDELKAQHNIEVKD